MERLFIESESARNIKLMGFAGWIATMVLAVLLPRSDFFGAAGAVGLCALVSYIYVERQSIERSREGMRRMFGSGYHEINRMTRTEYDQLSDEKKHQFNETGADIGSAEMTFEDELRTVERQEVKLAIALTLQWGFGAAIFDAGAWMLRKMEVVV